MEMIFSLISQTGKDTLNPLATFFIFLFPLIFMFVFMYLFFIRPQQKEEKERLKMINSLKKGDKVITLGGIIGTVVKVDDSEVMLRTGPGTLIKFEKNAIRKKLGEVREVEKSS